MFETTPINLADAHSTLSGAREFANGILAVHNSSLSIPVDVERIILDYGFVIELEQFNGVDVTCASLREDASNKVYLSVPHVQSSRLRFEMARAFGWALHAILQGESRFVSLITVPEREEWAKQFAESLTLPGWGVHDRIAAGETIDDIAIAYGVSSENILASLTPHSTRVNG